MTAERVRLRDCSFFEQFAPSHIEALERFCSQHEFEKDEIILREGDASGKFYLIVSGTVALEAELAGQRVRFDTLFTGKGLGMSAVLGRRNEFQARALGKVGLLGFDVRQLQQAFDADPLLARRFLERLLRLAAERVQVARRQLDSLAQGRAPSGHAA